MSPRLDGNTVDQILDVAEHLVQVRGFNAFSYADVSAALGIRKASLHHHFATKADLGVALIERYRRSFLAALAAIEAAPAAGERLARYIELYRSVLRQQRMCMCGMLAADIATLPAPMRRGVARFFSENEAWLARVLAVGRSRGELHFAGAPARVAAFLVSALEGALLVSRGSAEPSHLDAVASLLLGSIAGPRSAAGRRPAQPRHSGRAISPRSGRRALRSRHRP